MLRVNRVCSLMFRIGCFRRCSFSVGMLVACQGHGCIRDRWLTCQWTLLTGETLSSICRLQSQKTVLCVVGIL
jgi:hypothetical protein